MSVMLTGLLLYFLGHGDAEVPPSFVQEGRKRSSTTAGGGVVVVVVAATGGAETRS